MFWKLSTIWMGALVGSFSLTTAAEDDTIRVFVYNYARVSAGTMDVAKAVASGIFRQAGLNLEWADCALRSGETSSPSPCAHVTQFDIQLRILDAAMAKNVRTNALCLGYAVTTGEFGAIAAVYHQRALNLAREGLAPLADILGAAMAHEIGHLLLAQPGHSAEGLMRTQWDRAALKMLTLGRLLFDHSQANRMAEMARKRVEERTRSASAPSAEISPAL